VLPSSTSPNKLCKSKKLDAEVKLVDVEAKLLTEESQIMLVYLSVMDVGQRAWFEKNGAIILPRDAWLHLSTISYFASLTLKLVSFCTLIRNYL
jgi:hypothetical protein